MQPIRKPPTPTVNNQGKYRNLNKLKEEKSQPNPLATHPQPTTDPILPQQGRGQGASRTMPSANDHTLRGTYICTWGSYIPDPRADKTTKRKIGNRNQPKRKCVAGRSSDHRPTGNEIGRECMSPGGNRGGRHQAPTPNSVKSHARSHDNHPSPQIRREQRPRV